MNMSIGVPGFVRVGRSPESRAAVFLPQFQPSHSLQIAVVRIIQAPPPTGVCHSP